MQNAYEKGVELGARRRTIQGTLEGLDPPPPLLAQLQQRVAEAQSLADLEELYLPYKPKRKTRASVAQEVPRCK